MYLFSVSIATGYGLDDRGIEVSFPVGARELTLFHSGKIGSGTHPASYTMYTERCSFGVNWPGREPDHSPSCSVEVNNGGFIPPLPIRLYGFMPN
jgi:hypothetical protein